MNPTPISYMGNTGMKSVSPRCRQPENRGGVNRLNNSYKKLIEQELEKTFASISKSVKSDKVPKILYEAMHYSVFNGGKRIRPILCVATYKAMQKNSKLRNVLPFACGLEFIHTFSLIQDDLPSMDNDDYRRGKPSLHKAFNEGIAILAADGLFALAFELFSKGKVEDKRKISAINELAQICGINGLVSGQVLDIISQKLTPKLSEAHTSANRTRFSGGQKLIDEKKTAALIIGSMKIGAIIAGANNKIINKLEKAGTYLGLLFQTTDDMIDKVRGSRFAVRGPHLRAEKYAEQANKIFSSLGAKFNWFNLFTDYLLERKE